MPTAETSRTPERTLAAHEPTLWAEDAPEQLHLMFPTPDFGDDGLRSLFREVCWRRSVDPKMVAADLRLKPLTLARWEFCWRARGIKREGGTERYSFPMIGLAFKRMGRPEPLDHTSVIHAVRQYQKLIDKGEA